MALTFSIMEPMPAGMLLEMQSTPDLGTSDAWRTLASKSGNSGWASLTTVTSTAPSGGKVTLTFPAHQSNSSAPRQYFRLVLSSY